MKKLLQILSALVLVVSCKSTDKGEANEGLAGTEAGYISTDTVLLAAEPTTIEFERRYSVVLPEEYVGWPDPGEDDDYPAIFSLSGDALSVHTPIYELSAPNYFTYQLKDSLIFESARTAHEIDDYWYHLRVDEFLLGSVTSSSRRFEHGEAYFFRFPANKDSLDYWVLFNLKEEAIELYRLNMIDSTSNLINRFECFKSSLREMSIINECRFRAVYNSVLYYNKINNGYFYIDFDKGKFKCGTLPEYAENLLGVIGDDSLFVANPRQGLAWLLDQDRRKVKTFKWTLDNSVDDELIFDPRQRKLFLSKYDWNTFQLDIYEAKL